MDADRRRADDQLRLYREVLVSGYYIAAELGAPHVAAALRL
jgi:hypothetical protein